MRRFRWVLLVSVMSVVAAQTPYEDTSGFDRAAAAAGLTRADLAVDLDYMRLYGGDDYALPLYWTMQHDPWRIPALSDAVAHGALERTTLVRQISAMSLLTTHGSRRAWLEQPLDDAKKQMATGDPLYGALLALRTECGKAPTAAEKDALQQKTAAVPLSIAKPVALIIYGTLLSLTWYDQALAPVRRLPNADKLLAGFPDDYVGDTVKPELQQVLDTLDFAYLYAGAQDLADALDQALPMLHTARPELTKSVSIETPLGSIVLSGPGANDHTPDAGAFLIIDANGDDKYTAGGGADGPQHPVGILIDLGGNDKYAAADAKRPTFGAARLGYGFLIDDEGNDEYTAQKNSQGSGSGGVGALLDTAGNDRYSLVEHGQGAGSFGLGLLWDKDGSDTYSVYQLGQGFGFTLGVGFLVDHLGNDRYVANDTDIKFPSAQSDQHNGSLSQGFGFGLRADFSDGHSLAGGIGVLVDGTGDDFYSCGVFGQGGGYWYGVGILADLKGKDSYHGIWYVQGACAHFAVGVLFDAGEGDDTIEATMNMAQGAGHDFSSGFLFNAAGNDIYKAPNLSLGAGNANGAGYFWEVSGADTYQSSGTTLGSASHASELKEANFRHSSRTIGVFLDQGGTDTYPAGVPDVGNNKAWRHSGSAGPRREVGAGLDEERSGG